MAWQVKRLPALVTGLNRLGFTVSVTESRGRVSHDPAVILGTTFFREVEDSPGDWLLVDRASYGDPEFVQLVWNGHGNRGDHKVPTHTDARFISHGVTLKAYQGGSRVVLCGQERAYSPDWTLSEWYAYRSDCSHFRPHPAVPVLPVNMPVAETFKDCGLAVTLNSSVAIQCLIDGIRVEVDDVGGMAYSMKDRETLFPWLAYTQWTWEEIETGQIRHLF